VRGCFESSLGLQGSLCGWTSVWPWMTMRLGTQLRLFTCLPLRRGRDDLRHVEIIHTTRIESSTQGGLLARLSCHLQLLMASMIECVLPRDCFDHSSLLLGEWQPEGRRFRQMCLGISHYRALQAPMMLQPGQAMCQSFQHNILADSIGEPKPLVSCAVLGACRELQVSTDTCFQDREAYCWLEGHSLT